MDNWEDYESKRIRFDEGKSYTGSLEVETIMLKQIRCGCGYSGSAIHIGVTSTGSRGMEEELSACPKCNLVYADIKHHSLEEQTRRESRNR